MLEGLLNDKEWEQGFVCLLHCDVLRCLAVTDTVCGQWIFVQWMIESKIPCVVKHVIMLLCFILFKKMTISKGMKKPFSPASLSWKVTTHKTKIRCGLGAQKAWENEKTEFPFTFIYSAAKNSGISSTWFKLSWRWDISAQYILTDSGQAKTSLRSSEPD